MKIPKPPKTIQSEIDLRPYAAASVANMFLNKSFLEENPISPMKIQKLLYLAHGYHLCWEDQPLIDEVFQAWKFGPVLSSIYFECRGFGHSGITSFLCDINVNHENDYYVFDPNPAPIPSNQLVEDLVKFVWDSYKEYAPTVLSQWTHEKDGPWYRVTQGGTKILKNQEVPNRLIRDYFKRKLDE